MTRIIDGKAIAAQLRARIAEEVARLTSAGERAPGLSVVIVGDDPASQAYVRSKARASEAAGIRSALHTRPAHTSEAELLALIDRLNADDAVDGILVQLPLPQGLDARKIVTRLDPEKDVDGLHPVNLGRLVVGEPGLRPCTPLGCMMLARGQGPVEGARALVIGRSILVGKPLALMLTEADATVTLAHSKTRHLEAVAREADILVAAAGRPGFVRGDWIKPGATVLDVGINRVEENGGSRLVGDVAFDEACERAGAITPVPGGVGPMTVACLLANTLQAFCRRQGLGAPDLGL